MRKGKSLIGELEDGLASQKEKDGLAVGNILTNSMAFPYWVIVRISP